MLGIFTRRDSERISGRMKRLETGETGQGEKQSGDLLDAVEEDMKLADVREEDAEEKARWRQRIC